MFKALMLEEKDGKVASSIQQVDEAKLPEGDVTVAVSHSTLNYKDGLILLGQGRLVRQYPHIPGVDFSGKVMESAHKDFKPGDAVVLTGWRRFRRDSMRAAPWRSAPRASLRCWR